MAILKFLGGNEPGAARRIIGEALVGIAMLAASFAGIAASDVSAVGTQGYWTMLTVGFAVAAFVLQWLRSERSFPMMLGVVQLALHWVGVFLAIQLVYLFIATGRFANADTGLVNGLILALGAFTCGVYVNWRLMVVGLAVGFSTFAAAYVEQYLWVLLGVALLAVVVLVVGTRVAATRRRQLMDVD
jgi:hypothetical protein